MHASGLTAMGPSLPRHTIWNQIRIPFCVPSWTLRPTYLSFTAILYFGTFPIFFLKGELIVFRLIMFIIVSFKYNLIIIQYSFIHFFCFCTPPILFRGQCPRLLIELCQSCISPFIHSFMFWIDNQKFCTKLLKFYEQNLAVMFGLYEEN